MKEKEQWWLGLDKSWKTIIRTKWNDPRPEVHHDVLFWIQKVKTDQYISTPDIFGSPVYQFTLYDAQFKEIDEIPIQNNWFLVGMSTPTEWRLSTYIHMHIRDPKSTIQQLIIKLDHSRNFQQFYRKIKEEFSDFDSWASADNQDDDTTQR